MGRNAKEELVRAIKDEAIKCAIIREDPDDHDKPKEWFLRVGYTEKEMTEFLNSLDFSYDAGYGGQELFGTVWLKDGTWLSRGEYDGSEWWEHNKLPEIPTKLK